VELGQVEGEDAGFVHPVDLRLVPLRQLLLVVRHRRHLEGAAEAVRGRTQVMDDDRRRLVDQPQACGGEPQAQVHVLAVGGREGRVEAAQRAEARRFDHEAHR
jgi:hypothetical protein